MRALFLHTGRDWDGHARIFATVARALAERGYDTWFGAPSGSEAATQAVSRGIDVVALAERRRPRADAARLREALPRGFADVVFVHDDHEHLTASFAVRKTKRGGVVRRIGAGERLERTWRARRAERLAPTRYLYTSESPPSGHAAPSGAPAPMRAELGVAAPLSIVGSDLAAARVLVCIATHQSQRRASHVVRAAALLAQRHRELTLRVIGSVAFDEDLRLLAAALGIARRVEWLGHPRELTAALAGAAAGWVIADGDEAALGALELMAHGIPVLAERSSVAARYVSHGIHGTLMATLDPALMAAETAVLLADGERRDAMGAAGRSRIDREFPLREMLAGFEHAVRSVRELHGAVR